MNAIVLLFLVGLVLFGFEVFVPGGILGIIGGLALAAGVTVAYAQHGAVGGTVAAAIALALAGGMLFFELYVLPRTKIGRRLFLQASVRGTSAPPLATPEAVVGKPAEALTVLSPSGYVLVEGRRYEAFCRSGHVEAGTALRVVGLDNFRLIVST